MNLDYYYSFITAAEEMNFTKAAERLYISQQALSKRIDMLEKHYHLQLFDRTFPMRLTPAGECFYKHISHMVNIEKQMQEELKVFKENNLRELSVGISPRRSSVIIPDLVKAFMQSYPNVCINVKENSLAKLTEALKLRKVDCIFGYDAASDPLLEAKKLITENNAIIISRDLFRSCFSAGDQEKLLGASRHCLKDFAACPMIKLSESTWLGKLFEACCKEENFLPDIVLQSSSVLTSLMCAVKGIGVAACPVLYVNQLSKEDRDAIHIFYWDYSPSQNDMSIIYLKNNFSSQILKEFVSFCKRYFDGYERNVFNLDETAEKKSADEQ